VNLESSTDAQSPEERFAGGMVEGSKNGCVEGCVDGWALGYLFGQ
jgi:hypothetical protein